MPEAGLVYILSNSIAERTIKVGRTNDLKRRLKEHNGTSAVIGHWEAHWFLEVPDTVKAENLALNALKRWSVKGRREQFNCDPKKAVEEVSVALAEWSEWGKQEAARRKASREETLKQQKEERRQQQKIKAAAIEKEKEVESLTMFRKSFADRKKHYEEAKRVIVNKKLPPYPWGYSEPCLAATFVGAIYWVANGHPIDWVMTAFCAMWFIQPSINVWNRLKNWWRYDFHREMHAIEDFELFYPEGKPPANIQEVRAIHARIVAKNGK